MHTKKLIAAMLALMLAGVSALVFAGSATATEWHVYEGDVFAGHAYGLAVPADATSIEFAITGDAPVAKLAVFDPAGVKVAFYQLDADLSSASIIAPAQGRYAVYVYEVAGALQLRVNSESAPELALQKLSLARKDIEIGVSEGGAFSKAMTTTLPATPVFATLLYEGSVEALDARVESERGAAVSILGETGTAFSPGVWSSLRGERSSAPENLVGATYTVTAHAEKFEGRMILTTLVLDLTKVIEAPATPDVKAAKPVDVIGGVSAIKLEGGKAIAFTAKAGMFEILTEEAVAHEAGEESDGHGGGTQFVVALYAPDDSLVAYLSSYEDIVSVELPVDGEYVAFTHAVSGTELVGRLADGTLYGVRELELITEAFEFELDSFSTVAEFELLRAPVVMDVHFGDDAFGAFTRLFAENENGAVAEAWNPIQAPGIGFFAMGPREAYVENFAAGAHTLYADGAFWGTVVVKTLSYVRDAAIELPVEVELDDETSETPAEEPAEEPAHEEPTPFVLPIGRAAPQEVHEVAGVLGIRLN